MSYAIIYYGIKKLKKIMKIVQKSTKKTIKFNYELLEILKKI